MSVVQAPKFALTPAQADNEIIDYTSSEGKKLYALATMKLSIPFDGDPANLETFLESIQQQAHSSNWAQIMTIPDKNGELRSIIDEYGLLTKEDIRNHVDTYLGTTCRDAQNSYQLYICLRHSITREAADKVTSDKTQYLIGPEKNPSGVGLLFRLIKIATVHTRSTVNTIRKRLYSLENYMVKANYDIEKFNRYVKGQREALTSRGESPAGLISNIFTAYEIVKDPVFKAYMTTQQDAYVDGKVDITEDELMELALNKYKILLESEKWNAPSDQDSQIIALTAEIDALKHRESNANTNASKKAGNNRQNKSGNAWKKVCPEKGDPTKKTVKNTTYNWCVHHKYWTIHSSADCRGIQGAPPTTSKKAATSNKTLQAESAIVPSLSEDDDWE